MTFPPPGFTWRTFRGNISALNRDDGICIGPGTIGTRWQGERMDYSLAIGALIAARARSHTPSESNSRVSSVNDTS